MEAVIKVEKFLMRQGIRVGKAAIEFKGDGPLDGFHLVGFTICYDPNKGENGQKYVMFPMAKANTTNKGQKEDFATRNFFFLRPDANRPGLLDELQTAILDVFESMESPEFRNVPRLKQALVPTEIP